MWLSNLRNRFLSRPVQQPHPVPDHPTKPVSTQPPAPPAWMAAAEQLYKDKEFRESLEGINAKEMMEILESAKLFYLVGQALSIWAAMEEGLVQQIGWLLRAEPHKAGIVMYSILNFNAWLSIGSELFAIDDKYGAHKGKWDKIAHKLRALKDTRDRLAHHTTYTGKVETGRLTLLRPGPLDQRAKSQKYQPLGADEIIEFHFSLRAIVYELSDLTDAMTGETIKEFKGRTGWTWRPKSERRWWRLGDWFLGNP